MNNNGPAQSPDNAAMSRIRTSSNKDTSSKDCIFGGDHRTVRSGHDFLDTQWSMRLDLLMNKITAALHSIPHTHMFYLAMHCGGKEQGKRESERERERERERETDREQTDRQIERQTDRETDRRTDRQTEFVCLFDFLTSSSTTRLYRGRAQRQRI